MTHPTEDALLAEIESREDDITALAQALIRIPSVNPPGEFYRDCAELIGQRLAPRGFQVEYLRAEGVPGDTDRYPRWNVVARREGAGPGPCVHFNGHIDVVDPGEGWTRPPFEARIEDGRVYGRGACDMKGGLAAAIVAVEALIDSGAPLPGAIEICGTGDEESGGLGGVAWLAERGWFSKPRVDHVIIPEPLNVDRVCIGHRGVWWGEIETKGRIAHGSMPFLGDSAIRHMAAVLEAFETELYPALDGTPTAMPVEPPGARTPTLNINSVHGGQPDVAPGADAALPAPLVADACRLVFDRRLLIEEDLDEVKAAHARPARRPGPAPTRLPLLAARPPGSAPLDDRARPPGGARRPGRRAQGAGPRAGDHLLARHLRPEAHRPHRPSARLHRLRPRHPRPRPPAGRIRGDRRDDVVGQGDGAGGVLAADWGGVRS